MMSSFKQRFGKIIRNILTLMVLLLLSYGITKLYKLVVQSDRFFVVQQFEVHGTKYLTHRDIVALSKVKVGDEILKTDLKKMENLIARSPYVKHIVVERRLPSTVYIVIDERKPLAYINSDPIRLISEDGVALPRPVDFDYPDLPVLIHDGLKKVNDGDRITGDKISTALQSLLRMRTVSNDLFRLVAEVNLNAKDPQFLAIMGGAEIHIPGENQTEQFLTFHYFLEKMKNTNFLSEARSVDLRFKDRVIITDRKG